MDLADIRRLVIIAVFSDDVLYGRLVLKGGNAISLVYGYGGRGSLDVDFSIDGDFEDLADAAKRIEVALSDRFRAAGHVLFDYHFVPRPLNRGVKDDRWGGYRAEFKIIERDVYEKLRGDLEAARRNATAHDAGRREDQGDMPTDARVHVANRQDREGAGLLRHPCTDEGRKH